MPLAVLWLGFRVSPSLLPLTLFLQSVCPLVFDRSANIRSFGSQKITYIRFSEITRRDTSGSKTITIFEVLVNKPKKATPKPTKSQGSRVKAPSAETSDRHGPQSESNSWGAKASTGSLEHETSVNRNINPKRGIENTSKVPSSQQNSTHSTRTPQADAVTVAHPSIMSVEVPNTGYDLMEEPHINWAEENSLAPGDENDCESPIDIFEEAPQLQAWVYETSNSELTVGERLQKSYWEEVQNFHGSR
ncbi:hypothetical protein DL98DRAFT_529453 [Cadophora sp. DSE1049]|nr:hypothetical protein DL98DRAFT_529453 [Cadophora sp. DSE1049]